MRLMDEIRVFGKNVLKFLFCAMSQLCHLGSRSQLREIETSHLMQPKLDNAAAATSKSGLIIKLVFMTPSR